METTKNISNIPDEMKEKLASLDTALTQIESVFQPLLRTSQSELYEKVWRNGKSIHICQNGIYFYA